MKTSKWLLLLMTITVAMSCINDNTTDAIRPISYIKVEAGVDSIYNINKNDTLIIRPVISQTIADKDLSYAWEIDQVVISHEKDLFFIGNTLGKYCCRLIVSNEDGKTFFPFILHVNSPYEMGITILSVDTQGNSMLSFMQDDKENTEFYRYDCFSRNNPDLHFAANAADIVQADGSLIIACQGDNEEDTPPTIYYLNEKTMVVENMFTVPEYDDFKPTKLGIPRTTYSGTSYPVLCENGKVYEFSTTESAIAIPRKYKYRYAQSCIVNQDNGYEILLWDNENNGLCLVTNGYGPYYCSKNYHLMLSDSAFKSKNHFNNRNLVAMAKINMTQAQKVETAQHNEMLVITSASENMVHSEVLYTDFWGYDYTIMTQTFPIVHATQETITDIPLNERTPCIANRTFYSLLFAKGNTVFRWNYNSYLSRLANAQPLLEVGSNEAVITGFEISDDHLRTYVTFYEPKQEGLNGSVWIFDTDKGSVLEKYDNICYRPVKMIYKNR